MRTYLGLPLGYWLATAVAGLALGLGLSAAVDRPSAEYLECWELLAAGDWDGAGCAGQWPALAEWAEELWGPDGDPETGWECGTVEEEGRLIPASCVSETELAERLAAIRAERSGERVWND